MFCWFYAAQAHISCGATALWMELVECFPNKLGKLLCANSCETNDKIICHTNQCTNSRSSMFTSSTIFWKIQCLLKNFSGSFCESVIVTVPIACLISGTVPEPTMCHVQYYSIYLRLRTLVMLLLRRLTTTKVTIPTSHEARGCRIDT